MGAGGRTTGVVRRGPQGAGETGSCRGGQLAPVQADARGSAGEARDRENVEPHGHGIASRRHDALVHRRCRGGRDSDSRFENSLSPGRQMPEASSGGLGLIDYDGDGWLDVYCVQGGPFPPPPAPRALTIDGRPAVPQPRRRDVRGRHRDGRHRRLAARLRPRGRRGRHRQRRPARPLRDPLASYALYRNRGDGTFEDVTESRGLAGTRDWPTSAAFADLDGDGDLDLYVCHYLEWDSEHPTPCYDNARRINGGCSPPITRPCPTMSSGTTAGGSSMSPGRPASSTRTAGGSASSRPTWTATAGSTSSSPTTNRPSCCSATGAGFGSKRSVSSRARRQRRRRLSGGHGRRLRRRGRRRPARPRRHQLTTTNHTAFYLNLGQGVFSDHTAAIGLAVPTRYRLGFGVAFLDANNDGRLDLATANGHVDDFRPGSLSRCAPNSWSAPRTAVVSST